MDPTQVTAKVKIKDTEYTLLFDLVTMEKFEEITGTVFLDFVMRMQDAVVANGLSDKKALKKLNVEEAKAKFQNVIRTIRMSDIRALLWAALHTYDDELSDPPPVWPMSINQLSRQIDLQNLQDIILPLWSSANKSVTPIRTSNPTKESPAKAPQHESTPGKSGGAASGQSEDEILASLERH